MTPQGHHPQVNTHDAGDETSIDHRSRFSGVLTALKGKFKAHPAINPHDPAFKLHQAKKILARLPSLHPSAQAQVEIDYAKEFKILRK